MRDDPCVPDPEKCATCPEAILEWSIDFNIPTLIGCKENDTRCIN